MHPQASGDYNSKGNYWTKKAIKKKPGVHHPWFNIITETNNEALVQTFLDQICISRYRVLVNYAL